MQIKVTVNTPNKQAQACMKTQKKAYLGFKASKKIIEEKLVKHNQFYWILELEPKDIPALTKNAVKGEVIIKKFYSMLFKTINRCNALQKKFKKGGLWIKKQLIKRLRKLTDNSPDDNTDFISSIENMNEEEIGEFITVNDKESMEKLLSNRLIIIEEVDNGIL